MTDSPNSTPNRGGHSEEGGPNHSKTADADSEGTSSKPSTEAVGKQESCSSDKDSSSSRADQNDDDNDKINSNDNSGENSEDVHQPCEDTSTNDSKGAASNSNFKGSNEAPADQWENRERANSKDGEKVINNGKVSTETNIGSHKENDMEENAPKNEDDLNGTNSKPLKEAVGQQKSSSSDKDSSSSTAGQSDDDNDDDDDEHIADNDVESNAENKVEEMKENKSEDPNALKQGTIRKFEDQTEHGQEKEMSKGEQFRTDDRYLYDRRVNESESPLLDLSSDDLQGTHSQEFQVGTPRYNAQSGESVHSHPFIQGGNQIYQPNSNGFNQHFDNDDNDQVGIGNNLPAAGGPSSPNDPDRDRQRNELIAKDQQIAELLVQIADVRIRERENEDAILNTENEKNDLPGTHSQEFQVGTPRYNPQTGESVHSHPFIQGGNQIYQPNTNGFNQHFDNDDNDQVGIRIYLPAEGPSSPNDPDRDRQRNELIAKDQQIAELLAEIADLRMRERRNKDAIVNTEYEKNSLRRERDEARRTINTLTMTKDGLIDDVTRLEENIRILEGRLHTTEEDNVTKDANIDTIRSRNSELQANCKTLSENLTAAKKKCTSLEANQRRLEEKVQCLEKDLEKLAEENTAKSVEISSLKESCGTLKESEIRHRGECDKLRKAYDEEKDKTRFMEDRMNSLSGRVDTLEAETEQKDRMIHRKESARQAANEAMQKSQDENQVLCEQLRDLQSLQVQLEQEKAKNHAATEQLIALRQQLNGMDTMQRNIHIWWEEYRLAMNERTQEKADYETCRRRLQTLESELVYVKEERDSLRETTRVDQIEKDRLNAHKHDLTTKLQNQVGQITNMSEEVRNRREAMDTYRREKENLKDRSFELERSLQTAERQIEGLRRDISDRDRDILYLRAQLSDVSDPRDGDGDDGGPGHGSRGHGNQAGSTPGETNSGQQGCFPNIQSSTVHYRPQTPSNSVGLRGQQNQGTPTSSVFGFPMSTSFTFTAPSSSSTPLRQHLSGNQGGPSLFGFSSPNSST